MANPIYENYTSSFSGTDMVVSFIFPNSAPLVIGTATTVNYSIYRQLAHVRTLGRITTKGFARGGRTVAGRIIFTVVKESIVEEIRSQLSWLGKYRNIKPDELPPFDILLTFANEFGQSSSMVIYGVGFTDETKVFSIEDIFTENVFTFLARDIVHMKNDETGFAYDGAAVLRGADEVLGNFKLSELIATQEDAERKKRLEEIARAEEERWAEPIMSDPGYPPVANDSGTGSSSGGTNLAGQIVSQTIQVVVFSNQQMTKKLAGATVYTTHNGNKVSQTTDANGSAIFSGLTSGATYTFHASKDKYGSDRKNKKVDAGQTSRIDMIILLTNPKGSDDSKVRKSVRYGAFSNLNAQHRLSKNFSWDGSVPQVRCTAESGTPVEGITVTWSYKQLGWNDAKRIIQGLKGRQESGILAKSVTNKDGVATLPKTAQGGKGIVKNFFEKGESIIITAKPQEYKDAPAAFLGESYWRSFEFFIDY